MKSMYRVLLGAAISLVFSPVISPKKVTVTMYKTDPSTWKAPLHYRLTTKKEAGILKQLVSSKQSETESVIKTFKKDTKIVYDDTVESRLEVCLNKNCQATSGELNLKDQFSPGAVIAIDRKGTPSWSTKTEVEKLIADNRQAPKIPLRKVAVYKTGDNTDWWTIKVIESEANKPNPLVVYDSITIKKDTTGLGRKLQVPASKSSFIVVNNDPAQKLEIQKLRLHNPRINIDDKGKVTISGDKTSLFFFTELRLQAQEKSQKLNFELTKAQEALSRVQAKKSWENLTPKERVEAARVYGKSTEEEADKKSAFEALQDKREKEFNEIDKEAQAASEELTKAIEAEEKAKQAVVESE